MEPPPRPHRGEMTHTQQLLSSAPTPHRPEAPPKFPSCLPAYLTQDGPSSYLEARGRHAFIFKLEMASTIYCRHLSAILHRARGTAINAAGVVCLAILHFMTTSVAIAQFHILTKTRTTETQWEDKNKTTHQKTFKLSSDHCIRTRIFEPTQQNQATQPSISLVTHPLLQREQRRSEIPLNRLEVGNKKPPWHPVAPLWDATG